MVDMSFYDEFVSDLIRNLTTFAMSRYREVSMLPLRNKNEFYHLCLKNSVAQAVWATLKKFYKDKRVRNELLSSIIRATFSFLKHKDKQKLIEHLRSIL